MTDWLPSSSSASVAPFDQLHQGVQRWIYEQGWRDLRAIQSRAIPPILSGDRDVIITAGTAGGKTEAAWLPILSALAFDEDDGEARLGVKALMISPLKALINDQATRLQTICEHIDLPVNRRHGDVRGRERDALKSNPDGVLLITPESLEALFVLNGPRIPSIFSGLRFAVVDELHAFIGSERGAQLQSLLHRIELATRRTIPRIALSATLADTGIAASFLRGSNPKNVHVITDPDASGADLRLQLRGYVEPGQHDEDTSQADKAIAYHLFRTLRGTRNLAFANSRKNVEIYTDLLARMSEDHHFPNEFFPHHGSLSRDIREDVEERLKEGETGTTAICTSTLEMGIDIGSVTSIAQIGSPGNVASLRQRLGRSGRRGQPAVLRVYIPECAIDERTHPVDQIRQDLIEAIAIIDLMLEQWLEPPNTGSLHLSTLVQQVLSVIAQHGGAHARDLYSALCSEGPFAGVTAKIFGDFLRSLANHDILMQASDGLLLPGEAGERLVNHYSFYAAFQSTEEYRLIAEGRALGTLPLTTAIIPGSYLIFAGRRWEILDVDAQQKVIEVRKASGGRVPMFGSKGIPIADGVRERMRLILEGADVPRYLDPTAQELLAEARDNYRRLRLDERAIFPHDGGVLLFPWCGDRVLDTIRVMLHRKGVVSASNGVALEVEKTSPDHLTHVLETIAAQSPPDPVALASIMADKILEKHDRFLDESLLCEVAARRDLDVNEAMAVIRDMITHPDQTPS